MRSLRLWGAALLLAPALLEAHRLPIRTYTTADGLARDFVLSIEQDSHGFLWFGTAEGLSRFDGYQFTNYQTEQGLPSNVVKAVLETRRGVYWVATAGGLCRFDPARAGMPRFRRVELPDDRPAMSPSVLYEDAEGGVWCGGEAGEAPGNAPLFHFGPTDTAFRRVDLPMTAASVTGLLLDRRGLLWIGAPDGLYTRGRDGSARRFAGVDRLPNRYVMALVEDHDGRVWVGTRSGLLKVEFLEGDPRPRIRVYTRKDGLPSERIESLLETSDDKLWAGTNEGLAEWTPGADPGGREFRSYSTAEGLTARSVGALEEDRDGNLWIGTFGSGAMKVAHSGFLSYAEADGVRGVVSLLETRSGDLCAVMRGGDTPIAVARFDGDFFAPGRPVWPGRVKYFGWGRGQIAAADPAGEWWIATGQGLCRFEGIARVGPRAGARPGAVYTTRDGLSSDDIFRVFEDSRRDVWIGTIGPGHEDGLALWQRSSGKIRAFSEADGLPPHPLPTAFAEDRSGDVWVGLFHGGVARYRGGRFEYVSRERVAGFVHTLFLDSAGRLWIGTSLGLVRVEDPAEDRPRLDRYDTAQGLSSSDVAAITEDRWGRIYAATGRGIDRFEPAPGGPARIRHYTTADGVAPGELQLALRDGHGALWFSTPLGISRLVPALDRPRPPPPVLVTGLSIGGVPRPVSDLGEQDVSGLAFPRSSLRIDWVALGFSPGEALRYQYRLEGADADWRAPTEQRSVEFAGLSPGSYRFLVRAVTSEGSASEDPARVAFSVLPPVWRTWWFLGACGVAALLIVYALHRYRLARLLALAEIRTRIATDLHDDIGSSLSQIAILSEVARRRDELGKPRDAMPLSEIARISRELVDSMGDIVWAINPEHDRLSDLVHRMRRFATDLLGGQEIALAFRSSFEDPDPRVDANAHRQVYLIFKEAVRNVARHSGARATEVDLDVAGGALRLTIGDDGRGFDPAATYEGHGLVNMRRRAAAVGGTLEWRSAPGEGARLTLTVSLGREDALAKLRGRMRRLFG